MNARQRRKLLRAHQRETIESLMDLGDLTDSDVERMDPADLPWWWEDGVLFYREEGDGLTGEADFDEACLMRADGMNARRDFRRHLHRLRQTRQCPHCRGRGAVEAPTRSVLLSLCRMCFSGRVPKGYLSGAELEYRAWRKGRRESPFAAVRIIGACGDGR